MKDELEKQIGKIATKYIYKDGDIYVFYSRKHLNKTIKEIAGLLKQPVTPTLSREKVIEVLKKWMSYNHNETYESIASELCDAGEREESPKELIPDTSKGAKQYNFTEVDPIIEAMQKEYLIQAENLFFDGIETKPPSKDIPPECCSCGHQNSESCNTCRVLNPQFDGA